MRSNIKKLILFALVFAVVLIAIDSVSAARTGDVLTPITVNLSIAKIPVLNENANISCKVISIYNAPNTTAKILLPEGAELVSRNLTGSWDLKSNVPAYLNATIRFTKTGDFKIEAIAGSVVDAENSWGDIKALYLTIGREESFFTPGPAYWGSAAQSIPGNVTVTVTQKNITMIPINKAIEESMPSAQEIPGIIPSKTFASNGTNSSGPDSPGSLTVTGHYQYWTQLDDYRPNPNTYDWAREVLIEVIRASDSTHLGWGYTDLNGYFSIDIVNPGSDGFRVINYAYTKYGVASNPELRVVSDPAGGITGLDYVWRWTTNSVLTASDGVTDIGTWHPINYYEACWLQWDLQQAWRWIWFYNNRNIDAKQGTIVWYPTSTDGTYYILGGQIHLASVDAKSADTALHEYGHNVMYNNYAQWFPQTYCPFPHYMTTNEHVNCAWTEGWADFFPLVINANPTYTWASGATLNLETPTWGTPYWDNGEGVEGRVAGALWDIYDNIADGNDIYSMGFNQIEDLVFGNRQNRFLEFWNQWLTNGYSQNAVWCIYQNTIDYRSNPPITPTKPSGPATGVVGSSYSYSTRATDPNGDKVMYTFNWGDSTTSTTGLVNSGVTASASHSWSAPGTYQVTAMATDSKGATSAWSTSYLAVVISPNNRPDTPILLGPATGTAKTSYGYSAAASDSDGNQVKFTFDWGDSTTSVTALVNSGSSACASHVWAAAGTYHLKVKATDSRVTSSDWSNPWDVTISSNSGPAPDNASSGGYTEPDTNVSIKDNPPIEDSPVRVFPG